MNKYEKGKLYNEILDGLSCFINTNKVEDIVKNGVAFISRELETYKIYTKSGPVLEGIVLNTHDPEVYLAPVAEQISMKINYEDQQKIYYGAILTVYESASDHTNKRVSFETFMTYAFYIEPVLKALGLYHTEEGLRFLFEESHN